MYDVRCRNKQENYYVAKYLLAPKQEDGKWEKKTKEEKKKEKKKKKRKRW